MLPSSYQVMQVLLIASAAVLFMLLGICVYLDRKVNEYYRAWQATRLALDAANERILHLGRERLMERIKADDTAQERDE